MRIEKVSEVTPTFNRPLIIKHAVSSYKFLHLAFDYVNKRFWFSYNLFAFFTFFLENKAPINTTTSNPITTCGNGNSGMVGEGVRVGFGEADCVGVNVGVLGVVDGVGSSVGCTD